MSDLRMGEPIIGFEIAAGQMEFVDEDGVATAPIVGLTLIDRERDRHQFILDPQGVEDLAALLVAAGRSSLDTYYPHEARKQRRRVRLSFAGVAVFFGLYGAFNGWSAATSQPLPSVSTGVLTGIESIFMLLGLAVTMHLAMALRRRRRARKVATPVSPPENP